jgi:hypothetical protein
VNHWTAISIRRLTWEAGTRYALRGLSWLVPVLVPQFWFPHVLLIVWWLVLFVHLVAVVPTFSVSVFACHLPAAVSGALYTALSNCIVVV